ncbi:MAG: GNAT family N-acetyltransferase, partial [Gemmatimonas sp.]
MTKTEPHFTAWLADGPISKGEHLSLPIPQYEITKARPDDLTLLPAIELAAARLLVGHAPGSVLAQTTSAGDFERSQRDGHLLVARANDIPVGFAHVKVLAPGILHLDEIDVHPEHGRRGVGMRLVKSVCALAEIEGFRSVTLTTFRNVRWNMPFYTKAGFEVVPHV